MKIILNIFFLFASKNSNFYGHIYKDEPRCSWLIRIIRHQVNCVDPCRVYRSCNASMWQRIQN